MSVKKDFNKSSGIKKLMNKYKKMFRIPENLNHYSSEDYKKAERKFIKNACIKGKIEVTDTERPE